MKSAATAHEVARLAKVSQSAVSRSFTPGASVSEATRAKVMAAASALGYRPNALARSLITRRSGIVALVMSYLENQFYPLVIERLSQQLQQRGLHVLMFIGDESEASSVIDEILQYQVDGIVMASTTLSPELARHCASAGVPIVLFNRVPDIEGLTHSSTSSVTSDNHRGGRLVADLLLQRGFRRIAYLAGLENSSTNLQRELGFRQALAEAGITPCARAVGNYDFGQAQQATRELFTGSASRADLRPEAVFVANDHMAIAAMDVLRTELGLKVPQDVSVVGFDDVPQAAWGAYRLTTVVQDVNDMVAATVELLDEQMNRDPLPRHVVVPCRLALRDSVGHPANQPSTQPASRQVRPRLKPNVR